MSKNKRYRFHSKESPEELLLRIEEAVPLYNSERYGKELKFTRTERGFCLEVMRANFGAHCYEAEVFPQGGSVIDGEMRYVKDTDNFSALDRFFHRAGLVLCWIILAPIMIFAACVILVRLRAHGSQLTKGKTLIDFMENFVFCEQGKENECSTR